MKTKFPTQILASQPIAKPFTDEFRRWARTQTRLAAQWTLCWPVWMRLLINRQASSLASPRLLAAVILPHICKRIHSNHRRQAKPMGFSGLCFISLPSRQSGATSSPWSAQEQVRHWRQSAGVCPSRWRAGGPVDTQLSYGPASLRGAQFLPCYCGYILMGAGINSYCKLSLVFLKIAKPKQPVVSSTGKSSKVWISTWPRWESPIHSVLSFVRLWAHESLYLKPSSKSFTTSGAITYSSCDSPPPLGFFSACG